MDIAESVQCHKVMVTMKVINGRDIFWGGLALCDLLRVYWAEEECYGRPRGNRPRSASISANLTEPRLSNLTHTGSTSSSGTQVSYHRLYTHTTKNLFTN